MLQWWRGHSHSCWSVGTPVDISPGSGQTDWKLRLMETSSPWVKTGRNTAAWIHCQYFSRLIIDVYIPYLYSICIWCTLPPVSLHFLMSTTTFNPFLHWVNKNVIPSNQIHTVYTDNAPVGVDELIRNLGPYAACVDHCAHTTGKAGNYGYLFCVFCGKRQSKINLYIRIQSNFVC